MLRVLIVHEITKCAKVCYSTFSSDFTSNQIEIGVMHEAHWS